MAQRASVPVYLIKAPCRYGPNMAHYGSGLSHMAHMAHMAPIWLRTPQFKAEYEGFGLQKRAQKRLIPEKGENLHCELWFSGFDHFPLREFDPFLSRF